MQVLKQKFSSQADPQLLNELKKIAQAEGRQFQALLEEAITMLIEQRKAHNIRQLVMAQYKASLEKNRRLGELLAK
jgi:hypothetical protein